MLSSLTQLPSRNSLLLYVHKGPLHPFLGSGLQPLFTDEAFTQGVKGEPFQDAASCWLESPKFGMAEPPMESQEMSYFSHFKEPNRNCLFRANKTMWLMNA